MYNKFYGLTERPFNHASDSGNLYLGSLHKEALEFLASGIRKDYNLLILTGDVGSGKTIILKSFIRDIDPAFKVMQVFYPPNACLQLFQMIFISLGNESVQGDTDAVRKELTGCLVKLRNSGKTPLLVIDEAQNLDNGVLQEVLRLSELRHDNMHLVSVIVSGLPQLQKKISSLLDAGTKINAIHHLKRLPEEEVPRYIQHRLAAAGLADSTLFPPDLIEEISLFSGGAPRLINTVCDALLLEGYLSNEKLITPATFKEVLNNLPNIRGMPMHTDAEPLPATSDSITDPEKNGTSLKESKSASSQKTVALSDDNKGEDKGYKPDDLLPLKILVLENKARVKVHFENHFQEHGYTTFITSQIEDLLKTIDRSAPVLQIIVTDTSFFFSEGGRQDSAGEEALERIQETRLPVIMTSTLPLTSIRSKLLARGIPLLLQKPDLNRISMSEITARFDMFFDELLTCIENIHSQFEAFHKGVIKFTLDNSDKIW